MYVGTVPLTISKETEGICNFELTTLDSMSCTKTRYCCTGEDKLIFLHFFRRPYSVSFNLVFTSLYAKGKVILLKCVLY